MANSTLRATADGDADPDAGMLRALLASARLMPQKEANAESETAAIRQLQQAAHLRVTGKDGGELWGRAVGAAGEGGRRRTPDS